MSEEGDNQKKNNSSKFIDKTVDFIFSKDIRKWVLLTFILGFILRVFAAIRAHFYADEMIYISYSIGFIESAKLQPCVQSAVWMWITNFFSNIFGTTILGIRFPAVLFGSLSIILIYLLGKELFSKKTGLLAAFIFAISPFQFMFTVAEIDISMAFFALFAMYLLIRFFRTDKKQFFIFGWISLGIAIMIKPIALLFIPAFVIFSLYYNKKYNKKYKVKQIIYAAIIIIILVLPVLTFNFMLYRDKGILDMQFARATQKGIEPYGDIIETIQPFSFTKSFISYDGAAATSLKGMLPGSITGFKFYLFRDNLVMFLLGLLGVFFIFKNKNKFRWLLILSFLFPFCFLSGSAMLAKHYTFGTYFFSVLSAYSITQISGKISKEQMRKFFMYICIIALIVASLVVIYQSPALNGLIGKNHLGQVVDYKYGNMNENSLVVVDARIYRGRIAFMFWDRNYIESTYFPAIINNPDQFPGELANIETYFVEAITDDSGWGTIKDQPDFNQSTEQIVDFFKTNAQLVETIEDIQGQSHFNIYKTVLSIKPSVLDYIRDTHVFFYYPIDYKPVNENFDHYELYNAGDILLDKLAHWVLYFEILIAFFLSIYLFYLLYKAK